MFYAQMQHNGIPTVTFMPELCFCKTAGEGWNIKNSSLQFSQKRCFLHSDKFVFSVYSVYSVYSIYSVYSVYSIYMDYFILS
jgi:hypothetical protein